MQRLRLIYIDEIMDAFVYILYMYFLYRRLTLSAAYTHRCTLCTAFRIKPADITPRWKHS